MNQLRAFLIYLKNMKIIWIVALLILVTQLFSTKMAMIFTQEQKIVAKIEVVNQDKGEASTLFLEKLAESSQFEFVEKQPFKFNQLFKSSNQGQLVINDNFSNDYLKGNQKVLDFYVASGIQNTGTIREIFSASLLQMMAQEDFDQKVNQLNVSDTVRDFSPKELFQVEFHQLDENQQTNKNNIPLHLFGLFLLIFLLLIFSLLPGMDLRRFRFLGNRILVKQQLLVLSIIMLAGLLLIASFSIIMPQLVPANFSSISFSLLGSLLVYILGLGMLLVNLNLRRLAIFMFIPWFILNMTLGGGLWGIVSLPAFLKWLFPLSLIIEEQALYLASFGLLFFSLAIISTYFTNQLQSKNNLKR